MPDGPSAHWVEEHLGRWAASRDREALGELLKWQRDRAFAVAFRILGQEAEAEDAVQQAFLKLFATGPQFPSAAVFQMIVCRMTAQCAIDAARARRTRQSLEKAMAQSKTATRAGPADHAEQAEALRLLGEEFVRLLPEDRALLTLCCQEGLSLTAAAEALAVPRETARDRLSRLLADLQQRLKKRGVLLSLLFLIGLFAEGRAKAATAGLRRFLDEQLPGAPCAEVPPAVAPPVEPAGVLADAGMTAAAFPAKVALAAAAVVVLAIGVAVWRGAAASRAGAGDRPAVGAPPPRAGMPVGPTVKVTPGGVPAEGVAAENVSEGNKGEAEVPIAVPPEAVVTNPHVPVGEGIVPLDQLPPAIRSAAAGAVPGLVLIEAERKPKDGQVIYEFDGKVGEVLYEVRLDAQGKVLEAKVKPADDEDKKDEKDKKEQGNKDKVDGVPPAGAKAGGKDVGDF